MRIIIPAILILVMAFLIPKEKCTSKLLVVGGVYVGLIFSGFLYYQIHYFSRDIKELLWLQTGRMESSVGMVAVYINFLSYAIVVFRVAVLRLWGGKKSDSL